MADVKSPFLILSEIICICVCVCLGGGGGEQGEK